MGEVVDSRGRAAGTLPNRQQLRETSVFLGGLYVAGRRHHGRSSICDRVLETATELSSPVVAPPRFCLRRG